jgi:hypothetical protein
MYWDQISKTWTHLLSRVTLPRAPKSKANTDQDSVDFAPSTGREYAEEKATPFTPDGRVDRGDSSLHLSC